MTRFRIQTIVRILLLTANIWAFVVLLPNPNYRFTTCILGFLIVFQIALLIRFVESTQQHFSKFLSAIRQSDFSQMPSGSHMGSSFDELSQAYEAVLKVFRKSRAESEEKARYLQMVLQHARVGLIGFKQNGTIEIQNQTARKLLGCNQLRHLDDLRRTIPKLADALEHPNLQPNTILKLNIQGTYRQLVLNVSTLQFQNTLHTLVSLYDIQSELEEKEMEAWQTLIRVLTHEIMNSITPISSLAETAQDILKTESQIAVALDDPSLHQVQSAMSTIHKRSQNLLDFVENYRKLTRIPLPDFQHFPANEMVQRIAQLMQKECEEKQIRLHWHFTPDDLKITGDPSLIEQLCINLVTNAIQAIQATPNPEIRILGSMSPTGRAVLEIHDNGTGMEKEVLEKIFIPFFTTKSKGSGIGLSLSRQIMRMHGGSIQVRSTPEVGTCFTLLF